MTQIPEAAVEAAARGMLANSNWGDQWDDLSGLHKDWWRATATSALEAAAPFMLAGAWDEGHESGFWNGRLSQLTAPYDAPTPDIGADHAKATNPYRIQA